MQAVRDGVRLNENANDQSMSTAKQQIQTRKRRAGAVWTAAALDVVDLGTVERQSGSALEL